MPRLPRLSGLRLIQALAKVGFALDRQSGSHAVLRHGDGRMVVVPVHGGRDLQTGTLRAILRQAGMRPENLVDVL